MTMFLIPSSNCGPDDLVDLALVQLVGVSSALATASIVRQLRIASHCASHSQLFVNPSSKLWWASRRLNCPLF
jgi:hypothetical protein